MQINGPPISTAQLAKTPLSGSIAAANRSTTGNLGGINAESSASASGGGGVQRARPRRGHKDPHLGQNVDMWV